MPRGGRPVAPGNLFFRSFLWIPGRSMRKPKTRDGLSSGRLLARAGLCTVFLSAICLGLFCNRPFGRDEAAPENRIRSLFPRKDLPAGWRPEGKAQTYSGRELYEYINGGADLYLEYGFDQAAVLEYKGPDDAAVIVDIYRMASPTAAYGIFSLNSGVDYSPVVDVGTLGAVTPYQFTFCKGEYFVGIQSLEAGGRTGRTLGHFARSLDSRISGVDTIAPALVRKLPTTGLLVQSVTLCHGLLALNSRRYLGEENIFELGGDTWAVLGNYQFPGEARRPRSMLLVVEYPDSAEAARVLARLNSEPGPAADDSSGLGPLIAARGNRLAAWFDLADDRIDACREILNEELNREKADRVP